MTTDRKRGYLYILLAAMLYSTTEVALKALGGAFAPMQVTVERVLLGAAALMPFALNDLKKRDIQLTKADWGYFTLLGFLTVTLHMSLLQMAVLHMDASATSIIYSGNPVFAVALAHFILHEPLKKNHLLAIGVELVGILFILNPAHLEISLRGFLEIITATLLFATYGTLCKLRLPRLGALVITTFNMLIGGLELLFLLLLGEIPAVGALYSGLGLEIFAGIPFFTGFTLKTTLLLCHVGIGCAAILSISLVGYPSANVVTELGAQGICISAGSACHRGQLSHVYRAMGLDKKAAAGVLRVSFGPETTKEEIDALVSALKVHRDTRFPML